MLRSKSKKPTTYVGYTKDLKQRIKLHNSGKGAKFTRGRTWVLIYTEVFNDTEFKIQKIPDGYVSSYFTYAVESPFEKIDDWKSFHDHHINNGGDDFYAAMILGYEEPIMKELGYYEKCKGTCPVAEKIQPKMMQFKTNYRTLEEAEKWIKKLKFSLDNFM